MAVIHISEADAARDFASLMARVREGSEVVIENGSAVVAVLKSAEAFHPRLLSESIALAKEHAERLGYEPRMGSDFASDLDEIINHRKPGRLPEWD